MNYKTRIKEIALRFYSFTKPFLLAGLLVVILQITGLIGAASFATHWTLLQTGLRDAEPEITAEDTPFDYDFTIKDLDGNKIPFDQFKGKVVFLNLWATWCSPCRAEMPSIQSLYEKVDREKIVFVMLSIDRESDIKKVSDYLIAKEFTFQAYLPSGQLPSLLRVPSIPTTFIISKSGQVIKKEVGSTRYDTPKFQKFLEELSN